MPLLIDDLEIFRCAKLLIDQHGDDASIRASEKEDAMLAKGDVGCVAVWRRIRKAITEIQRASPKVGEHVH